MPDAVNQYFHDEFQKHAPGVKTLRFWPESRFGWEWQSTKTGKIYDLFDMPIVNVDGSVSKFEIFYDITERKQAEVALKRLNHHHQLILRSVTEGILGLDPEGKHVFVNSAAAKMLGYEAEELIGSPSHATWHHTQAEWESVSRRGVPNI